MTAAAAASGVEIGEVRDAVAAARIRDALRLARFGIGVEIGEIGTTGTDTVAAEAQETTVAAAADWSWIQRIAMVRVQAECKSGCRCCLSNPKRLGPIP